MRSISATRFAYETPVVNLQPVSTTPALLVAIFATGVIDTGGKFAASVIYTGGAPWLVSISANLWKILHNSKVPKCENFAHMFFTPSQPIWLCELGTWKNRFLSTDTLFLAFSPHSEWGDKQQKLKLGKKLKVGGGRFWAHMNAYNEFFWKTLN
jgi:hypothetical protein